MTAEEFRAVGHALVERLADFLDSIRSRPVSPNRTPEEIRALLGSGGLPETGAPAARLLEEASDLLLSSSVFSGHPRFLAYIVSSPAPIGALADLLAAAVNPNLGAWNLSPIATEIELQAIRWIAEMLGYPVDAGGLLTSGGNMANFVGFLAARRARTPWDVRTDGTVSKEARRLALYASTETHTWLQKAADLFGLGTEAIRWIETDESFRMDADALRRRIGEDRSAGRVPFLVVATAGTVATGAVDPLPRLSEICRDEDLWLHVDAAYGGFAVGAPGAPDDLAGLALADSVAVDPHKWLYAPLEAGCTLVRRREDLHEAFHYRPSYYHFRESEEEAGVVNFYQYGPQNSRGFRALKVWLGLRMAGREGYRRMIAEDIELARALLEAVSRHAELEPIGCGLSVTTFRYVPQDLAPSSPRDEEYLDSLNEELLSRLQESGEIYLSNAIVRGRFVLRACIVNFRTSAADVAAIPEIVARLGRELDRKKRMTRS